MNPTLLIIYIFLIGLLFVSKFSKAKVLEPFRNPIFRKVLGSLTILMTLAVTATFVKFLPPIMKLGAIILNFVMGYFIVTTFMSKEKTESESK
jgi:hypothetical protein